MPNEPFTIDQLFTNQFSQIKQRNAKNFIQNPYNPNNLRLTSNTELNEKINSGTASTRLNIQGKLSKLPTFMESIKPQNANLDLKLAPAPTDLKLAEPSAEPLKEAGKFKDKLGSMSTSGITDVGLDLLGVEKTGANTLFDAAETPLNALVPGLGTGLSIASKVNSVVDQKLASKFGIAKDLNLNTGVSGYSDDSVKGTKSLSSGSGADVLHTILPVSRLFSLKKTVKKVDKARAARVDALKSYAAKKQLAGAAQQQMAAANQSMQNVGITNQNQLNNVDYGAALMAKEGGVLKNVIPSGALHAHNHSLEIEGITKKGIPVISEDGGELIQHAEIEREEVILTLSLTEKLEVFRKENNALEAGKLLAKELMENTIDNTDLTEKLFGNEN